MSYQPPRTDFVEGFVFLFISMSLTVVQFYHWEKTNLYFRNRMKKQGERITTHQAQLMEQNKNVNLGILSKGVAHEINNPLAILKSSTELINMNLDNTAPQNKKLLDMQKNAFERIYSIIESLRAVSAADKEDIIGNENLEGIVRAYLKKFWIYFIPLLDV